MSNTIRYSAVSRHIRITAQPSYLADRSAPEQDQYVWAYHITIDNEGEETVQLRTRHWQITDSMGRTREVHGDGVVGVEPRLKPGESFAYTSGAPLPTPSGLMRGTFMMQTEGGECFDAVIPAFSLDSPHEIARPN